MNSFRYERLVSCSCIGLFILLGIFHVLEAAMAAAPATGGAVAVLVASGIAALIPGFSRPRASSRLAAAGAWAATILFLPGWWTPWLNDEWRTPTLLLTASLPPLLLVSWRDLLVSRWRT